MKVLILRKCKENRTSHNGSFTYPESGYVEASDWNGEAKCGGGLHGLLWGHGSFDLEPYGTLFQVIEAESENVIEFNGKCKFKCGMVLFCGSQQEAIALLKGHPNYPQDNILNYDIQIGVKLAIGGYRSTLTGGDESVLTGGDGSTLTGGDESVLKGGDESVLTGGYKSVFIVYAFDKRDNYVPFVKRITTKATANKTFKFMDGVFHALNDDRV